MKKKTSKAKPKEQYELYIKRGKYTFILQNSPFPTRQAALILKDLNSLREEEVGMRRV